MLARIWALEALEEPLLAGRCSRRCAVFVSNPSTASADVWCRSWRNLVRENRSSASSPWNFVCRLTRAIASSRIAGADSNSKKRWMATQETRCYSHTSAIVRYCGPPPYPPPPALRVAAILHVTEPRTINLSFTKYFSRAVLLSVYSRPASRSVYSFTALGNTHRMIAIVSCHFVQAKPLTLPRPSLSPLYTRGSLSEHELVSLPKRTQELGKLIGFLVGSISSNQAIGQSPTTCVRSLSLFRPLQLASMIRWW